MKKNLSVFLFALLFVFSIFSNGQNEKSTGSENGPVTISYGFWGNPDAIGVEQEIIDAFEAQYPNIKVEPVVSGYGEYHTKMLTMLAGGQAPDVMRIDSYFFQDFTKMNAFRQIDDLVARDNLDLDAYYKQGIAENTYKGNLYGLPWGTAALYMLINLDVMEEANLELPDMDWTVDDFTEILKAFGDKDDVYGYATELNNIASLFPFVWANGGDIFSEDRTEFTLNSPKATAALQNIADMYQAGLLPQDSVIADPDILTRWFVNNKVAMRMGSAAEILSLQKVEGVRFEAWPMPGAAKKDTTVFKSNVVGLNGKSDKTEAAWTFLKYLRGDEGETLYMKAKRIPPTLDNQKYWDLYGDITKYPKLIEENSRQIAKTYGHNLPIRPGWLEVQQIITPTYAQIFLGEMTAQEAMDSIADKVQAVLDRTSK